MSEAKTKQAYSAAMLVIGNEILSGRTQDLNVAYAGVKLAEHGIFLSEVRVVPDIEDAIVGGVNALRGAYDYVFTSGGIGPTHDDITADSVAAAFGVSMVTNDVIYKLLLDYHGGEEKMTPPRKKMAQIPEGARLVENPVAGPPGFAVENVYVMAGVPKIMQGMLDVIIATLPRGLAMLSCTIECALYESQIALGLGELQDQYPDVDMGSYPKYGEQGPCVHIVLRSIDKARLKSAKGDVAAMVQVLQKA